jgi:hypothetical protein
MDLFQALIDSANLPSHNLPVSSRYHPLKTAMMEGIDGEPIIYLRRRFIPPAGHYSIQQQHTVTDGERLDTITAHYMGDPEQFWQVADANQAMKPEELTEETGRKLKIPSGSGF